MGSVCFCQEVVVAEEERGGGGRVREGEGGGPFGRGGSAFQPFCLFGSVREVHSDRLSPSSSSLYLERDSHRGAQVGGVRPSENRERGVPVTGPTHDSAQYDEVSRLHVAQWMTLGLFEFEWLLSFLLFWK